MTDIKRKALELVERIDEQPWSRWLKDWEREAAARSLQSEIAALLNSTKPTGRK